MRPYVIFIACFALFVVGMATVRQQAETIRLGYRLHLVDRQLDTLKERYNQYALEVESLRSPRRVFAYARSLDLSPPVDGDVRIEQATWRELSRGNEWRTGVWIEVPRAPFAGERKVGGRG